MNLSPLGNFRRQFLLYYHSPAHSESPQFRRSRKEMPESSAAGPMRTIKLFRAAFTFQIDAVILKVQFHTGYVRCASEAVLA